MVSFIPEYARANPIKGILLSALFFGIAHMNFQQFCYAFFLGIVFGFLIEATDSIVSSMTAHMVFNASSLLLTYLLSKADIFKTAANTAANNASSTSIATIIASVPMAPDRTSIKYSADPCDRLFKWTAWIYENMVP